MRPIAGGASSSAAAVPAMCDRPGCVSFAAPGASACAVHLGLTRGASCFICRGTGRLDLHEPCPKCCGVGVVDERRAKISSRGVIEARGGLLELCDRLELGPDGQRRDDAE